MRIVLLRHGKPNLTDFGKIKAGQLGEWIESYNSASLDLKCQPNNKAIEITKGSAQVVCSNLSRSIESAKILAVNQIHYIDSDFREVELPYIKLPLLRFSPDTWSVIFRVLWFCRFKSNSESLAEAKLRASIGASKLKEIAKENDTVIFIGHGFLNRFIAKELLSSGWNNPTKLGNKYWEFGVYEYSL